MVDALGCLRYCWAVCGAIGDVGESGVDGEIGGS